MSQQAADSSLWTDIQQQDRELRALKAIQAKLDDVPRCGARRHCDGRPCRVPLEPGRKRCRVHGGWNTGAKTEDGKRRAREAVLRRWERWRQAQQERIITD